MIVFKLELVSGIPDMGDQVTIGFRARCAGMTAESQDIQGAFEIDPAASAAVFNAALKARAIAMAMEQQEFVIDPEAPMIVCCGAQTI